MTLTATQVKQAKPREKQFKLSDERGMYLLVTPNGSKYWRLKYRYAGKEKTLAFGVYPEVSLAEAIERRDIARRQIRDDIDPGLEKKKTKEPSESELNKMRWTKKLESITTPTSKIEASERGILIDGKLVDSTLPIAILVSKRKWRSALYSYFYKRVCKDEKFFREIPDVQIIMDWHCGGPHYLSKNTKIKNH